VARRARALRRRYGHARTARSVALQKKADRQEAQAHKIASRATGVEHKIDSLHHRSVGAELKLKRQLATLKAKAADLLNEAGANRALAGTLHAQGHARRGR